MRHDGFHGRAGFGEQPALLVIDVNVGFTDPESPLVCDLDGVVDALQHGYRPIVPREAVGDRNAAAHGANLYDIDAKYDDVVSLEEVLEHLEELAGARA